MVVSYVNISVCVDMALSEQIVARIVKEFYLLRVVTLSLEWCE